MCMLHHCCITGVCVCVCVCCVRVCVCVCVCLRRVLSKKVGSSAAALGRGAGVAMEMVTGVCALLWLLGVVRLWHKGR